MLPSPTRRVVPPGHTLCRLTLTGSTPLLMSNAEVDREDDTFIAYRTISKKRGKSLEDEDRLRELEWYTRLYYDAKVGVFIPGRNVKELLRSAATKWKRGEDVKRSLVVPDYRIPLIYDGPSDPAKLWDAGFSYTTMVANSGAGSGRVPRTRPCFEGWSLECDVAFDPVDLDFDLLCTIVERSEKYGLGDYRPEFGAFVAKFEIAKAKRGKSNAKADKPRDVLREKANSRMAERITA